MNSTATTDTVRAPHRTEADCWHTGEAREACARQRRFDLRARRSAIADVYTRGMIKVDEYTDRNAEVGG